MPPVRRLTSCSPLRSLLSLFLLAACATLVALAAPPQEDTHVTGGAQVFSTAGCTHCHGEHATGTDIGPSLAGVGKRKDTAALVAQIHDGGGAMPAFGDVLTGDQIADLVVWLQTLKPARKPRPNHGGF